MRNLWMGDERLAHFRAESRDDIDHAVGYAGLADKTGQLEHRRGCEFGRLDDYRTPGGQCRCKLPTR